ncbi:MAG: hypothetical protein U1E68_06365 [Sphingomonadaceae bacterium]|jgi:hypothetical protein
MASQDVDQINVDGSALEARWERGLVIISIPHGAAFGAFYGNYDFSRQGGGLELLSTVFMLMMLPLMTAWLFLVHDLLRNVFLRQGYMGSWLKIKHSFYYYCCGLSPSLLLVFYQYEPAKDNREVIVKLAWVLCSWAMCATLFSNSMYLRAAKALGMEVDD